MTRGMAKGMTGLQWSKRVGGWVGGRGDCSAYWSMPSEKHAAVAPWVRVASWVRGAVRDVAPRVLNCQARIVIVCPLEICALLK